jgi:hypothetical protein
MLAELLRNTYYVFKELHKRNVILYLIQENSLAFFESNIRQILQTDRIGRMKPNHSEVNYKTLKAVVSYKPQQIRFPYKIDLDLLA